MSRKASSISTTTLRERALKRIAIGRKNWLFAGHDEAAKSCAILTTLIASSQRHGIDPQAYLTGVLARIAAMPVSQLEKLLPERWNCTSTVKPTAGQAVQ